MTMHEINGQLSVIEQLEKDLKQEEFMIRNLEKCINFSKDHAEFYLNMQRKILSDEKIGLLWKNLITIIKLSSEKSVKGITNA